ncbi:hypothetical protein [Priestia endophytica]|uniref:hypothetical protein n=1 Tax=Priestia endophytica TaxID=135735 RepID=UPI0020411921|nr:hypothetical protein [Priestia endophytica]MCM3540685.1 hypothetical protein [Priestia endophytica]
MNQLYSLLNEAGLIFKGDTNQGEEDFILLETYEDETTHSVDVDTFEMLFGDIEEEPTYKSLSGSHAFKLGDTQYTMTADEMGYQKYFDQWKMQGII